MSATIEEEVRAEPDARASELTDDDRKNITKIEEHVRKLPSKFLWRLADDLQQRVWAAQRRPRRDDDTVSKTTPREIEQVAKLIDGMEFKADEALSGVVTLDVHVEEVVYNGLLDLSEHLPFVRKAEAFRMLYDWRTQDDRCTTPTNEAVGLHVALGNAVDELDRIGRILDGMEGFFENCEDSSEPEMVGRDMTSVSRTLESAGRLVRELAASLRQEGSRARWLYTKVESQFGPPDFPAAPLDDETEKAVSA